MTKIDKSWQKLGKVDKSWQKSGKVGKSYKKLQKLAKEKSVKFMESEEGEGEREGEEVRQVN